MRSLILKLQDISYSKSALIKSCALLLLLGLASAGVISTLLDLLPRPLPSKPDTFEKIFTRFYELKSPHPHPDFPPTETRFFRGDEAFWMPQLLEEVNRESPPPGARFALGLWLADDGNPAEAIKLFHQENLSSPHPLIRQCELEATLQAHDTEHLYALRQNPAYADDLHGVHFFHMGVITQNWPMILRWFWLAQYENIFAGTLLMVLVAGAIWTALILSLFPRPLLKPYLFFIPAALALGWISTWPTIWSSIWMETRFNIHEGSDFVSSLLYYLVSVGFREEICKLLLFTPLLLRVSKNGRDLEALLFGACVGLGFAIEENINYFNNYQGSGVSVSRFVSANLLHLSLTGVSALALTRAVRDPNQWMADAVSTLAICIGLHGLYNTLLSQPVPGLGDMSYFAGALLAGCSFLFFREIDALSSIHGLKVSRTALFCWGFCLLFNLELLSASVLLPFDNALFITGNAALSATLTAYIFLHQIQEPLSP
ncbi:PrsW family glutamic-type intramembrane protease [Kiritimatiellaeota bacterium B1221]|nr:PrsW family glutamic-type intramembrane protease [Kiritimatiellaeota bacterium B1221]